VIEGFWTAVGLLLAAYVGLFLAWRQVSLRPRRLAGFMAVVVVVRLVLLTLGWPWSGGLDVGLAVGSAAGAVLLFGLGRYWLCRVQSAVLRQQLDEASRGLFLPYTEPQPGCLVFSTKGSSWTLRLTELTPGVQLVAPPTVAGAGKMALLVQWLSKQYPGPIPRIRISLTKE
jgi:hypothetical protein